jgi:hypothetical protein
MGNELSRKSVSQGWQFLYETPSGIVDNGTSLTGGVKNFTFERTGSSNPKYKEQISRGQNATGNLHVRAENLDELVRASLTMRRFWTSTGALIEAFYAKGVHKPLEFKEHMSSSTAADNQALKYLFRAIQDRRTSFQGGVFLGEAREALRMLTSPAKALREGLNKYLVNVKTNTRGSKANRAKVLSDTWLEFQYGWQPLVSDIKQGVEAYIKHTEKLLTNRLTRRGEERETEFLQVNQPGDNFGGVPIILTSIVYRKVSVQYIVGLRFQGSGASPDPSVFERAGLTLSQFIPTVWNLIPYSFLVDYFTNIGDILEAGATNTSDVIWVCKTVRQETKYFRLAQADPASNTSNSGVTVTCDGQPGMWITVAKDIVRSSPPLSRPKFEVSIPASPTKWINMAALAISSSAVSRFIS